MSNSNGVKPVRRIELKTRAEKPSTLSHGSKDAGKNGARSQQGKIQLKPGAEHSKTKKPQNPAGSASSPKAVLDHAQSAMNQLLNIEYEARQSESEAELQYLMVNATRQAINYRQAFLLTKKGRKKYITKAVSSLSAVDRNSNFIRWIESNVEESLVKNGDSDVALINLEVQDDNKNPDAKTYPFRNFVLLPLKFRDGTVFSQLVLAREIPWTEADITTATRLTETYSHAWQALSGPVKLKKRMADRKIAGFLIVAALLAAGFLPIPLTVLAPAEVAASDPVVVAAPMNAVLENVAVLPNSIVKKGDLLFRFNDTDFRNRFDVAGQSVRVAEARYQQAQRNSFSDPRAKRDLAISLSELKLKAAEYDYARDLLALTEVRAPRGGLVIFPGKDELTGKPVTTGERIMRIADPSKVELVIDLSVADSIVLKEQARVRLFMDSAPLDPVEAQVVSASYHARPDKDGVLSYRVVAKFQNEDEVAIPRIGLRGTAQIHGDKVTLAFYIFRKPLSVIRQWIGF